MVNKRNVKENIKNGKNKKIFIIVMILLIAFSFNSNCLANDDNVTEDFDLVGKTVVNGEITYRARIANDPSTYEDDTMLYVEASTHKLPSNLYEWRDYIRLRLTYSKVDYKVHVCKVINNQTNNIIEDVSEENINKLFDPAYGKNMIEKSWASTIKLSELKENEVYKYTSTTITKFPDIKNDIGKNCIILIKQKDDTEYDSQVSMHKVIKSGAISTSVNEYNAGETFIISYRSLDNKSLLKQFDKDKIICLSDYKDGEQLKYTFEKIIYNDTNTNITVHTKDTTVLGVETTETITIPKGEIYGFDWMIDSAFISIEKTNNNVQNGNDNKYPNNSDKELPQAGIDITLINVLKVSIIISGIVVAILFIKCVQRRECKNEKQ